MEKSETDVVTVNNRHLISDIELESPVDLNISKMKTINLDELTWHNYAVIPKIMKVINSGRTVVVGGVWDAKYPFLTGGPLLSTYRFSQFHFHWGPNEMIGSEHSVDGARHPMELHAVHFDEINVTQEFARKRENGIAIVVYLFKLQSPINRALDCIMESLSTIKNIDSSTRITPEPLSSILRPFATNYFYYSGLLNENNEHYKVLWLISREPIGISIEQVAQFRELNNIHFKPILNNCKSLKHGKHIDVFHVNPSGAMHASLLPIPREYLLLFVTFNKI